MTSTTGHQVVRRYPYTIEEGITAVVGGAIAGGVAALLVTSLTKPVAFAVGFVLGALGCIYMSWSRKRTSQVTVTVDDQRISVESKGLVGNGLVRLDRIASVVEKEIGSNVCFVIREVDASRSEKAVEGTVRIPMRTLDDPVLHAAVGRVLDGLDDPGSRVRKTYASLPAPVA